MSDRGAASVWLLACGFVLVFAGVTGAAVGAATVARHRAQAAADLGALAGAGQAIEGGEVACSRAEEITALNGARMTACRLDGLDLTVTTRIEVRAIPGFTAAAIASARAGPVGA